MLFLFFKLKLFFNPIESRNYIEVCGDGYKYGDLKKIFEETDVLVAPSLCYETFGFTVLEALSFGTPVIVTKNVGAKDIVGTCGIVINPDSPEELADAITSINNRKAKMSSEIISNDNIVTMDEFYKNMNSLYSE